MATPIYKFWMARPTEAWYQLSEQERDAHSAKLQEAQKEVGSKTIITCTPVWSTEQWLLCGIEEFPDIDAAHRHAELLYGLDHYRYFAGQSMLGTRWPPS